MTKREDDVIWEDYLFKAESLVTELKHCMTLARKVVRRVNEDSDLDYPLFRDLERCVYRAYRTVGDMSGLQDEADDEPLTQKPQETD